MPNCMRPRRCVGPGFAPAISHHPTAAMHKPRGLAAIAAPSGLFGILRTGPCGAFAEGLDAFLARRRAVADDLRLQEIDQRPDFAAGEHRARWQRRQILADRRLADAVVAALFA